MGGLVEASMAVMLAADHGYSLLQIVDGIESATLGSDGSITGVAPEGPVQGLITARRTSARNHSTSLIAAALGDSEDGGLNVLQAILHAADQGYSIEQIIESVLSNSLYPHGYIICLPPDRDAGRCDVDGEYLVPAHGRLGVFSDTPNITDSEEPSNEDSDENSEQGSDESESQNTWPLGTWQTDGNCPASENIVGATVVGSTTFLEGGVLGVSWTQTWDNGDTNTVSSSGTWTLSGSNLSIFVPAEYSGAVSAGSSSISLSSDFCWSVTLTR